MHGFFESAKYPYPYYTLKSDPATLRYEFTYWRRSIQSTAGVVIVDPLKVRSPHFYNLGVSRHKAFFATRIGYYSNSVCTFHHARLIICGDVERNPGPTAIAQRPTPIRN